MCTAACLTLSTDLPLHGLQAYTINVLYAALVANTRPAAASFNLPLDTTLELRVVYDM